MPEPVYAVGVASTPFRRWPERTHRELAAEALEGVLADAGLEDGQQVEACWFGNCALGTWGQQNIRGQVVLDAPMRTGRLPERLPVVNVEAGCATGSAALAGAFKDVASGEARVALALGVEKTWVPEDPRKTLALFDGGIDRLSPEGWQAFFAEQAEAHGEDWAPEAWRIVFVDVHALQARRHMARHGTTLEHLAHIAAKNKASGALNPKAQLREALGPEEILADKPIVAPFTRSMCSPIGDGAAAVLLASEGWLRAQPAAVRDRAVRVRSCTLTGGAWRGLDEDNVVVHAARRAWQASGLGPADIDLAEVHDASSYCELAATEALGFCAPGEGGAYALSGATARDGERPVNSSGGLVSKGHPLGATGLGMVEELVLQLRGEAGERQVAREAAVGLAQNAGGLIGLDEALCGVTVLERVR